MTSEVVLEPLPELRKNQNLAQVIIKIIQEIQPPLTIRQLYYQLVARDHIQNSKSAYRQVQRLTAWLRKNGTIPYDWFTDRLRRPDKVGTWMDLADFLDCVKASYRKDLWQDQDDYVEIWLEKDALSDVFSEITRTYQVTLMVARGFSSLSFLNEAANDLEDVEKPIHIYYFGDHDPSGRNIESSIESALEEHGVELDSFERVAILPEDIAKFNLPPDFAKKTDPRYGRFVEQYGNDAVELDALPPDELRYRITQCIMRHINADEWSRLRGIEQEERDRLTKIIDSLGES